MSQNYANNISEQAYLIEALQWHIDNGADEMLLDAPVDRTAVPALSKTLTEVPKVSENKPQAGAVAKPLVQSQIMPTGFDDSAEQGDMMGTAQAVREAQKIAAACKTLEELKQAAQDFDGLSIRKTASNIVFSDGNPQAPVMLIGEAPGAEEDVQGRPFVGGSGQLLDRILACIDLSRSAEDVSKAVYLSNILNWRPPGNRTPSGSEIDISLPFIERHIALVQPKMIILCGGVPAKALLRSGESISKLRGKFHNYQVPEALQNGSAASIPAMATYHPEYLLRTPAQKKAVWADMLMFQEKLSITL